MTTSTVEHLPDARPNADVDALVETFVSAGDLLSQISIAIGNVQTFQGTSKAEAFEADLYSLVEYLAVEHGIRVAL